jgi:L-alanine-DL-glutamate epimerase-like enolase superfamily enzyme
MMLRSIDARALMLPFHTVFRHASATRASSETIWVEACDASGRIGYGEGCPRRYVTGESVATTLAFIESHRKSWLHDVVDLPGLARWADQHRHAIDPDPAAWCAVELAMLDLLASGRDVSIEALLGLPPLAGTFRYTAVIGDAMPSALETQLATYVAHGFQHFKIKLSGDADRDRAKVYALVAAGVRPEAVRVDANNLWRDADTAIAYFKELRFPFAAIEEPLAPRDWSGLQRITDRLGTPVILDESVTRVRDLDHVTSTRTRGAIVNVRVSKMGGLLRSLEVVQAARKRGMPVVIGAHVGETSLLTRAGLTIAHASRDVLVAQEGAFGTHLLMHDVAVPPLMFGPGGLLRADLLPVASKPGFGLTFTPAVARSARDR